MKYWWYVGMIGLYSIVACTEHYRANTTPKYHPTLPNPLRAGDILISSSEWEAHRVYLKQILTRYQYGEAPDHRSLDKVEVKITDESYVFDSLATKQSWLFTIHKNGKQASFRAGAIIPNREGRFPAIIKNDRFRFDLSDIENTKKAEQYREKGRDRTQRFAAQEAVTRGYVFIKFIRGDIAADQPNNRDSGALALYPNFNWGNIAAWGWAYSIIIDWLEEQPYVDADKITVTGHSRGGKTALYAGIYDERIAVTAPNSSGSGGTGSWRYFDPEQKPQTLVAVEPYHHFWFTDSLFHFADSTAYLPFDAHFGKMLIAPRGLVNMHARQDYWANPYGTHLTHLAAQPIFDAYGKPDHLALHWREGDHNQNEEDWLALYDFCDWIFYGKPRIRTYNQNPHAHYQYDSILNPYIDYFGEFGIITTEQ
ncbi:MAG: hypothetical protein AAF632_09345 [Bacteroidota bacterium]